MSDNVQFQDPWYARQQARRDKPSFLSKMTIKLGLAKTEKGAQAALLVIAIIAAVAAVAIYIWSNHTSTNATQPVEVNPAVNP